MVDLIPDKISGAGGGCGLLGGRGERALVLFAERVDGGVIVGGGGPAPLRGRLSTDRLQARAAVIQNETRIATIKLHQ